MQNPSILRVRAHLETLRDELVREDDVMREWMGDEKETGEDIAAIASLMSEVAVALTEGVQTFFDCWDFTEDCHRGREKEAAEVAATV